MVNTPADVHITLPLRIEREGLVDIHVWMLDVDEIIRELLVMVTNSEANWENIMTRESLVEKSVRGLSQAIAELEVKLVQPQAINSGAHAGLHLALK